MSRCGINRYRNSTSPSMKIVNIMGFSQYKAESGEKEYGSFDIL